MIQISRFKKFYHSQLALEIAELTIPAGIHWIQGSNGSGKTTLFRCLAGMLPFEGEVLMDGQFEISKHPVAYRMHINYGEAEPNYPDFLSAYDLIQFVGKAKKAAKSQIDELISTLEISAFMQNPVGTYSSGMLKKTSLVLAFLGQPKVILLDEPLITIDKKAVENMYALVDRYHQQGVTFLLSSHQDFQLSEIVVSERYQVQDKGVSKISNA